LGLGGEKKRRFKPRSSSKIFLKNRSGGSNRIRRTDKRDFSWKKRKGIRETNLRGKRILS